MNGVFNMTYTYVCSELHGMFNRYIALVNTLKNSDQLYIIGDVIDRGNDGIKILQDIITRDNVHMTLGNLEFLLREDLNQLAGCEKHVINKIISDSLEIGNNMKFYDNVEMKKLIPSKIIKMKMR